jgi:hypothetical protein
MYKIQSNTTTYRGVGNSDMFRLTNSSSGWVKNHENFFTKWLRAFGIPDGLQYLSLLAICNCKSLIMILVVKDTARTAQ